MYIEFLEARTLLAGYALDRSFGHAGSVEIPVSVNHEDSATAIAALSNGNSVIVGTTTTNRGAHPQLFLARMKANGSLDKSFGKKGIATTNFKFKGSGDWLGASAEDVQIESNGKIVVAGSLNAQPAAFRFNSNGSLDRSFSGDGVVTFKVSNMDPADITFGPQSTASSLALLAGGKILLAGHARIKDSTTTAAGTDDIVLARLKSNGALDNSFGHSGIVVTDLSDASTTQSFDVAHDVAVDRSGKIIVAAERGGPAGPSFYVLARYSANGAPDNSLGTNGIISGSTPNALTAMTVLSDNSIVAAGPTNDRKLALIKIDSNGATGFSTTIDPTSLSSPDVPQDIAVQPDGKFVVVSNSLHPQTVGSTYYAVSRFNANGSIDSSFSDDGIVPLSQFRPNGLGAIALAKGKITVVGQDQLDAPTNDAVIVRLNSNGSLDNSFSRDGVARINIASPSPQAPNFLLAQPDGKILVQANINDFNGTVDATAFRLTRNGALDRTFDRDGKVSLHDFFAGPAVYSKGKTVWVMDHSLLRRNANGAADKTFGNNGSAPLTGLILAPLSNGKLIAAGQTFDDTSTITLEDIKVQRLNANGTLDNSFGTNGTTTVTYASQDTPDRLFIDADGKITVVGHSFNDDLDVFSINVTRLNADGSLDNSFSGDGQLDVSGDAVMDAFITKNGDVFIAAHGDSPELALVEVSSNGNIDSTTPTFFSGTLRHALFDPNGNLLVFTSSQTLRFKPSGAKDAKFSTKRIADFISAEFDANDNLLLGRTGKGGVSISRYRLK